MVNLDADTAAKLLELEQMRRASASDVIRECIRLAHALALDDLIP
jgi:Arc/MetJ-type ribon-helix-helix transcriptional regulator